jgi:hypothetical protein
LIYVLGKNPPTFFFFFFFFFLRFFGQSVRGSSAVDPNPDL